MPAQHTKYLEAHLVLKMSILGLGIPLPLHRLVAYHPQRQHKARRTSAHCDHIGGAVALQALDARALATGADDAVLVKDDTVEQVEDVAGEDGGHCHEAPVLGQAVDAEALGHDRWEDAEEEAIAETGETRHETEEVRIDNAEGTDLGDEEDRASDD